MADISTEDLKSEIHAILKTADLNVVSAKKVREQLEQKLNCSLLNRKKEFTDIVMDFINQQQEAEEQNNSKNSGDDDSAASESEELNSDKETARRKKNAIAIKSANSNSAKKRQATTKKKKFTSNGSGSDSDSDNGSDSDYEQPKAKKTKKKAASGEGGNTTGRKSTGFTRAYTLSPELAELVGAESMPRHEVVKKVWALIKERQLYDPKNKQYAICDDDLLKVMKVKRFRAFSMLKHLKPHFID